MAQYSAEAALPMKKPPAAQHLDGWQHDEAGTSWSMGMVHGGMVRSFPSAPHGSQAVPALAVLLRVPHLLNAYRTIFRFRGVSGRGLYVHILGFLGGKFGVRAPFMLRRDISGAMIDLLYEYNAYQNGNIDEEDPYDIAADADFEHGYHSGRFSALRWVVHWEGETDSDSEFSDEEDDGEDEDWF